MNNPDCRNKPRFPDFQQAAANMNATDFANFAMWCWVNKQVPNPKVMANWMAAMNKQRA